MDLDLTDEQGMLKEAVRALCEDMMPTTAVRAAEHNPAVTAAFTQKLADMGIPGLRVPPSLGGSGLGLTDLVVAFIELGRALAPGAHLESGVLATALLGACAEPEASQLLRDIASGRHVVLPVWHERDGTNTPATVSAAVAQDGGGLVLTGEKHFVPHLELAGCLLVLARGPHGQPVLAVVCPDAPGIERSAQPNLADQSLWRLRFTRTPVQTVLGLEGGIAALWDRALDELHVGAAALAVGGAERVLEITTQYACEREQFGRPIGGFQAIAHYLADAAVNVAASRILAYRAASAADEGTAFSHFALMAKLKACKTFRDVSAVSIQIHGGLGFTMEADPQLFFRRAKQQQLLNSDPASLETLIGNGLFAGQHPVYA
ncbi:MAG TPA: acyl-CoA dehydrogenase family protein [Pedomonas sp.]|uniref:acyl-CoA dehydrogenase family protein n=1 Tax=Pedomonas sp. TaxID=2976421 RepID=UPI002F3E40D6